MPVTIKDVEYIARLANLEFSQTEKEQLTGQLNEILLHMTQLNRLNTESVEPLSHVTDLSGVMRDDRALPGLSQDEALRNAPVRSGDFFGVPKVISDKNG